MYIIQGPYKVRNNQSVGIVSSVRQVNHITSIKVCQIDLTEIINNPNHSLNNLKMDYSQGTVYSE